MMRFKVFRKFRRLSLYKKSLIIFSTCLFLLGSIFLVYVYNSMVIYERNLVDNYILYLAESGKLTEEVSDDLFKVSSYEKKNAKITDGIKKLYKSDKLKIKKNSKESKDNIYAYDLYNDNVLLSTVSLKSTDTYKRMGILKIDEWEIVDSKNYFDNGIYSYEIKVPEDYKVYVNDLELEDSSIKSSGDVAGLEKLTEYVTIMKTKTYEVNNLVYEPKIKIVDQDNKEVKFQVKDNKIVISKEFEKIKTYEEAQKYIKDNFDIMKLAENWSLFLTDDLPGRINALNNYLIKGSYMYERAYSWSTGVDISFVSSHRLKNPTFTNETLENFIIYNDNAFSCEVSLEKNMVVSGSYRVDKMHDRLYFVYYNGGYKLVGMDAIK